MGTLAQPFGVTTPVATSWALVVTGGEGAINPSPSLPQILQSQTQSILVLDAAPRATHNSRVQVTEHPVEFGSNVTDNARPLPDELHVDGLISAVPIDVLPAFRNPYGMNAAVKGAFDIIRNWKDTATVVQVLTQLHQYDNMVVEDFEAPETMEVGDSLKFTLKLKALRIISSQTLSPPAAVAHAQAPANKNKQMTTPATPQTKTTVLRKAVNYIAAQIANGSPVEANQPLNTSGGGP